MCETLITGASGEIGTLLATKYTGAILMGRKKMDNPNYIKHDLTNRLKPFLRVKRLIHLAGLVKETNNITNSKEHIEQNILILENLLNALPKIKSIIYASTCSVYGKKKKNVIDELHPTNPEGLYAASKLASEKILQLYCNNKKIKLCILRISSVYSPLKFQKNNVRAIQIFSRNIKQNKSINIFGSGDSKRDYIFLYDVVDSFLWAKNKEGIYNISSGDEITLNEIVNILGKIANKKPKIKYINAIEDPDFSYSSKRAQNDGFKIRYPIEKGLEMVYNSIKNN